MNNFRNPIGGPSIDSLLDVFEQIDRMRDAWSNAMGTKPTERIGGFTHNQITLMRALERSNGLSAEETAFLPHGVLRSLINRGIVMPTNVGFVLTEEGKDALHSLPK